MQIVFLFYDGMTALDAVGPHEILCRLPEAIVKRVAMSSGKIITAAGVSAGIDMALTLAAKISGERVAKSLQLGIKYDPEPPFDTGSPKKVGPELSESLRKRMVALFEQEML